jgi:hypothetical protein
VKVIGVSDPFRLIARQQVRQGGQIPEPGLVRPIFQPRFRNREASPATSAATLTPRGHRIG